MSQFTHTDILIIGGGAAGFFAAITCAEKNPNLQIVLLEKNNELLNKVRISGGGRCNVTHACFDAKALTKFYPRGERELLSPFLQFSASDTIAWFKQRGVVLKTESDGRMFPITDNSETIVQCLLQHTARAGVVIKTREKVISIEHKKENWHIQSNDNQYIANKILVASGSYPPIWDLLKTLGHSIVPPVPSLFTFNIKDDRIKDLAGLSVPIAKVSINGTAQATTGALLVTHWGMSGPAILKLSAWAARVLFDKKYDFQITVNWVNMPFSEVEVALRLYKNDFPKKLVAANVLFNLPQRLWKNLVKSCHILDDLKWADINKKQLYDLATELVQGAYKVQGKSTNKDEFVTAGGVELKEVNFKTFESKLHPNLFFAGEVLNIDAITGGFNFQAAWTGGWLAGNALSGK